MPTREYLSPNQTGGSSPKVDREHSVEVVDFDAGVEKIIEKVLALKDQGKKQPVVLVAGMADAGKSHLLRTLADRLFREHQMRISGQIGSDLFDKKTLSGISGENDVIYIEEIAEVPSNIRFFRIKLTDLGLSPDVVVLCFNPALHKDVDPAQFTNCDMVISNTQSEKKHT